MADETNTGIAAHGASRLPWVEIDSFNLELKDEEEFIGDRASKGAFRETLEKWRKPLRKSGEDPFGKELSEDVSKKESTLPSAATTLKLQLSSTAPSRTSHRSSPT